MSNCATATTTSPAIPSNPAIEDNQQQQAALSDHSDEDVDNEKKIKVDENDENGEEQQQQQQEFLRPSSFAETIAFIIKEILIVPLLWLTRYFTEYTNKRHLARLEQRYCDIIASTEDFNTWKETARALDNIRGFETWRYEKPLGNYLNSEAIVEETRFATQLYQSKNVEVIGEYLRTHLSRDANGLSHPLQFRYYTGTKACVEQYIEVVCRLIRFYATNGGEDIHQNNGDDGKEENLGGEGEEEGDDRFYDDFDDDDAIEEPDDVVEKSSASMGRQNSSLQLGSTIIRESIGATFRTISRLATVGVGSGVSADDKYVQQENLSDDPLTLSPLSSPNTNDHGCFNNAHRHRPSSSAPRGEGRSNGIDDSPEKKNIKKNGHDDESPALSYCTSQNDQQQPHHLSGYTELLRSQAQNSPQRKHHLHAPATRAKASKHFSPASASLSTPTEEASPNITITAPSPSGGSRSTAVDPSAVVAGPTCPSSEGASASASSPAAAAADRLTRQARYRCLHETALSYGRSALMLSGGASLGVYHAGVARGLFVAGLLPQIITGSSAGSIIGSIVCCRTDEELSALFQSGDSLAMAGVSLAAFEQVDDVNKSVDTKLRRLFQSGAFMDVSTLSECLKQNVGDLTFSEAFEKSGRILNISVSSASRVGTHQDKALLLNYLTSPNVLIWNAVSASCAMPGLFTAVELLEKDPKDGTIKPFLKGQKFYDGSVAHDLPKAGIATLFNVNYFIVSQTNPHVIPFLGGSTNSFIHKRKPRSILKRLWFAGCREFGHWLSKLYRFNLLPKSGNFAVPYLLTSQPFEGDLTIFPIGSVWDALPDYVNLTANPSIAHLEYVTAKAQRRTWPHLSQIFCVSEIERTLMEEIKQLHSRIEDEGANVELEEPLNCTM